MPARDLPREKLTPADDLRELLRQCELQVVALKDAGEKAVRFLETLDQTHALFQRLEKKGVDLRAEQTRWDTIQRQLRSRARTLVREVQAQGEWEQLRASENPPPDRWWWFLDREVQRQRQHALRRFLAGGGIALVVLIAAVLLYQRYLAPDPITRQAIRLSQRAEEAIREGDPAAALVEYENLYTLKPDDPEVSLWLGALYEELEQEEKANQAYARARQLLPGEADFFAQRGMIRLELGQFDEARIDAEKATGYDPESTMGYLVLGGAYEAQGQVPEAVDALQKAASLANAQGNNSLYALIQIRLGMLLQGSGGPAP